MKSFRTTLATLATAGLLFSAAASAGFAAAPKDYQFTGQVTAVTDTTVTVVKGKETSEFAKSADTKMSGPVAVGDKVTVHFTMSATNVEVAPAKAAAAPAKGSKKADKAAVNKPDMAAPAASGSPSKPAAEASPAAQ